MNLPDNQVEIIRGLAAGDRIVGPREVWRATKTGRARIVRQWTWLARGEEARSGADREAKISRNVHSGSVNAVLVKGIVEIHPAGNGERELVLRERG